MYQLHHETLYYMHKSVSILWKNFISVLSFPDVTLHKMLYNYDNALRSPLF